MIVKTVYANFILMFCLVLTLAVGQAKADITEQEKAILEQIDTMLDEQILFLEKIVNINSGTMNFEGVREVGTLFEAQFDELGFETTWLDMPADMQRAGHLVARLEGDVGKRIMLLGHLDTVFPIDSPFQTFNRDGDMATGPGIEDMKSGDAIILYALKALQAAGALEGAQINIMLTGDEENAGAPFSLSRGPMVNLAKESDVVLSFESGREDVAVIARRGSSMWHLSVTGRRAHSSGIFNNEVGAGAIFETSRILNEFYEKVKGEEYLTFNPGLILGGTSIDADFEREVGTAFGKSNVVAQTVEVHGGLRFLSEEQKERARDKMREIVANNLPQTSAEITFFDRYPAMSPTEGNMELFDILKVINQDMGYAPLSAVDPSLRGAGDISFVAPYISGIDALGATGRYGHTVYEQLDMRSIAPMTKRAALMIYRLIHQDMSEDD